MWGYNFPAVPILKTISISEVEVNFWGSDPVVVNKKMKILIVLLSLFDKYITPQTKKGEPTASFSQFIAGTYEYF